jgi:hypothetical protein
MSRSRASSSWIGRSEEVIPVGKVVHYRTHSTYQQGRWEFPAGMNCLATRSPKGELALIFLLPHDPKRDSEEREFARAIWLGPEFGLCGVEPGVLDPDKANHLMVQRACDAASARVAREIREEAARERELRGGVESDVMREAARHVAEDLDRKAAEEIRVALGANGTWNTADTTGADAPPRATEGTAGVTAAEGAEDTVVHQTRRRTVTTATTPTRTARTGKKRSKERPGAAIPSVGSNSSPPARAKRSSTRRPSTSAPTPGATAAARKGRGRALPRPVARSGKS